MNNNDICKFSKAEQEWDLGCLFLDIEAKQHKKPTASQQRNLKALLLGLSPKEASLILTFDEKSLKAAFSDLYRLIEELVDQPEKSVNYRNVPLVLARYRKRAVIATEDLQELQPPEETSIRTVNISNIVEDDGNDVEEVSKIMNIQEKINRVLDANANVSRDRLYGVENYVSQLKRYLDAKDIWLISVVGSGGVGKTSVVEKLVREYGAESGFVNVAWVTAKRTYYRIESQSKESLNESAVNINTLVSNIADQLQIILPPSSIDDDRFQYLQNALKKAPYLVVIDNLETLQEYIQLIHRFDAHNLKNNLIPSKIILTSREKIQEKNYLLREIELTGIDLQSTLQLIRYKGDHIERIALAKDDELLPIYTVSQGIPLIILLIVNLIATNQQLALSQIIENVLAEKVLYSYLYEETLSSISDDAFHTLRTMSRFDASSAVRHEDLKINSKLNDTDFNDAISECIKYSLIQNISSLTSSPRYLIHSILYKFLREL